MAEHHDSPEPGTNLAERLFPASLKPILDQKPLASFESEVDYDALLSAMIAEFVPRDAVEFILVKELVDVLWEMSRLKSILSNTIDAHMPEAICHLVGDHFMAAQRSYAAMPGQDGGGQAALTQLRTLARRRGRDKKAGRTIAALLSSAGVTEQDLRFEAMRRAFPVIEAADSHVRFLESRRDRLLRLLADRRQTYAAHKVLMGHAGREAITDKNHMEKA